MNAQLRIDAQVLELHILIAAEIKREPENALAYARSTLARWRESNGDHPYYREWDQILNQGSEAVVAFIQKRTERATLLRSVSPFATLLTLERDLIFWRTSP